MTKLTTIIAIVAIATLATLAIINGIDGAILASAFAIIGGLGGYEIGKHQRPR